MSDSGETPYEATEQHIRLLQAKRARITEALAEAEGQYAAALARELDAGRIGWAEVWRGYQVVRDGGIQGFLGRWQESLPHSPQSMKLNAGLDPRGAQEWSGVGMEVWRDPNRPPSGTNVVYVPFGEDGSVVYVGSTKRFASRISRHRRPKTWATWQAYRCRDREHAYEIESRFLRQHMGTENRQGPRAAAS